MQKEEAQRRVDQLRIFGEELKRLEAEGVLCLPPEDRSRVDTYHKSLLAKLSRQFDIDVNNAEKQLSWGMRIVSLLGALAISAALFFFFYRFWGFLATPVQVGILLVAPLFAILAIHFVDRRDRSRYFTSILCLVALTCFVLNLSVLGNIFNITPSQNAFLAWGALALILAYGYGLRLLLIAGMGCLLAYLSATIGTWSGCYWLSFGYRPETFIIAGAILSLASLFPHRRYSGFAAGYRIFGLLTIFIAILILANQGRLSYLPWSYGFVEYGYQIAGFLLAGGVITLGIRRHWPGTANLGSTFFLLFLYTKVFDWWWDWLPKYLFFLLLGLIAVGLLLIMQRLRKIGREVRL